jgi:hypothetical protein
MDFVSLWKENCSRYSRIWHISISSYFLYKSTYLPTYFLKMCLYMNGLNPSVSFAPKIFYGLFLLGNEIIITESF